MIPVTSAITDLENLLRRVPAAQRPAIEAILAKLRTVGDTPRDLEARVQFWHQVGDRHGEGFGHDKA